MVQQTSWSCSRHSRCGFFTRRDMLAIAGTISARHDRLWMGIADFRLHLHWPSRTCLHLDRIKNLFDFKIRSKPAAKIGFCGHTKGLEICRVLCRDVPYLMGDVHPLLLFADLWPTLWNERKQGQRSTFIPERGILRGPNHHREYGGQIWQVNCSLRLRIVLC